MIKSWFAIKKKSELLLLMIQIRRQHLCITLSANLTLPSIKKWTAVLGKYKSQDNLIYEFI